MDRAELSVGVGVSVSGSDVQRTHSAWGIAQKLNPFSLFADGGPVIDNYEEIKRDYPQES